MSKRQIDRRAIGSADRRVRNLAGLERAASSRSRQVIVVDEDAELGNLICFALESTGRKVSVHHDGAAALIALTELPDIGERRLLLLSVDLSGIDGHTVHERLVELRPDGFLVAFMSVRSGEADQVRALRAGAIDYLVKPISIPVLLEKIAVWEEIIASTA